MADHYGSFSSLLKKLKPKSREAEPQVPVAKTQEASESPAAAGPDETTLRTFSDSQLKDYVTQQSDRALTRLLQSLSDPELQLRIVQIVTDEPTLKRLGRSQLNKRVKRAAEKRLREVGVSDTDLKLQKLGPLNERMQAFFKAPSWPDARELLSEVSAGGQEMSEDPSNPVLTNFKALRDRLKREIDAYERTCADMESLCLELDTLNRRAGRGPSKSELQKIQDRWQDLIERYAFPADFDVPSRFEELLEAAQAGRPPQAREAAKAAAPDPALEERRAQKKLEQEQKQEAERQARLKVLDELHARVQEVGANLAHRQAGPELRKLQAEAAELRPWKREYAAKLDELEALIKTLSSKRSEVSDEARWDTWARTDQAIRIQTGLEKTIGDLEVESDPALALSRSAELTELLREYAQEMRSLGSLERGKDHKIWQQFKSLSDRGWAVCDRMRLLVLDGFKTILTEHSQNPIEFTLEALARNPISFKPSAFKEPVPTQVKEVRVAWLKIGTKPSDENRALEALFSKLFETYTKKLNTELGRIQKGENSKTQLKRDLLKELRLACEGPAPLVTRAMAAKRLGERWVLAPTPSTGAGELQAEFDGYQARIQTQLADEVRKQAELAAAIRDRAQSVLDQLRAKSGLGITAALKAIAGFESELAAIEKHLTQFGMKPEETTATTRALMKECKDTATQETRERAQERDRVLRETEALALSAAWETALARLEELKALWKTSGALGQKQDPLYAALFENISAYLNSRFENREAGADARAKGLKARTELLYALEALSRFRKVQLTSLPLSEAELRTEAPGKLLSLGMKYNQILALDPTAGVLKETRKIMEQWIQNGAAPSPDGDDRLPGQWKAYLERVRALLEIPA